MGKQEWGEKCICQNCGAKFYDLHKSPIICPACQKPYDPESANKLRRNRQQLLEDDNKIKSDVLDADLEVDIEADIDTEDDGVLEDTSDIDDGDDMSEVVGVKKPESSEDS